MKKKTTILLVIFFNILFYNYCAAQEILTIEKYLSQVEENNPDIKSVELSIKAIDQKILEMDMAYSPYFSGNFNYMDDKSGPGFGSTLPTQEMWLTSWNLGLNKKFPFGSLVSLGYIDSTAEFDLTQPTVIIGPDKVSNFKGYDIKPFVRVKQSLLKDYNSRLTQSGIKKAKNAARAGQYMQIFKKQQILLKAQSAYLSLSFDREVVYFRKKSLERAEKIFKWNEDKYNLNLADKSDLLQSQAGYKLRDFNLTMAVEDEVTACRNFNEIRGKSSEVVEEQLQKLEEISKDYEGTGSLTYSGQRADVLSAKMFYESSKFANTEAQYRSGPELSVFGLASLHGLDLNYSDAWSQVTGADKPTYTVGVNFMTSLDFGLIKKVRNGYTIDVKSYEESLIKTELSAKNDWEQILKNWNNVKSRLINAVEIKNIQSERLDNEQQRFQRGRTTTFQLLAAQNDLDDAELNVYRLILEQMITHAQTNLYNTKPIE
ncbi:MAG: TolC family protein [Elusimicrobia bacterium]|nr:TolC family protein [Elusimicrobiota bacterium]